MIFGRIYNYFDEKQYGYSEDEGYAFDSRKARRIHKSIHIWLTVYIYILVDKTDFVLPSLQCFLHKSALILKFEMYLFLYYASFRRRTWFLWFLPSLACSDN